jgi:membrane protease YdiL (CAAX protease family)
MIAGALAVLVAWRLVAAGRVTVWVAMAAVLGVAGAASLATGGVSLSTRMSWAWAVILGAAAGLFLYMATAGFVLFVRGWHMFDRHVAEIYDQRRGLALRPALALAAVTAVGEELFWRGLFQPEAARAAGRPLAAVLTWLVYLLVNSASGSLPIMAGAAVGGAVWGALAHLTGGVLAGILCHSLWTGFMLARPPGGPAQSRARGARGARR